MAYLISVQFTVSLVFLSLLLECQNNQSDENVEEEEGKDDHKEDIEKKYFNFVVHYWSAVDFGGVDRCLHKTDKSRRVSQSSLFTNVEE